MKERTMTDNVVAFPDSELEIFDFTSEDEEYDAGVTHAEQFLQELRESLEGQTEAFCGAVWDVIFDVFDDGE